MKINELLETTSAGSVAAVAAPMGEDKDLLDPLKGAYGELFGKQPKKEDPEKIALDQAMKKYKNNPKGLKAWLMKNRNIIIWLNTNDSQMLDIVKQRIGETTSAGSVAALKKARDNDEDEMEVDGKKIPVTEFILSMYDRETGQFPKGETAVLTAVEKDYGEQYINPAKSFIEAVNAKFEEFQMHTQPQQMEAPDTGDYDRMRELAGLR